MVDDRGAKATDNRGYLIERRLNNLFKGRLNHIANAKLKVSYKCHGWNVKMMSLTFVSCLLGIIPYINLNIQGSSLTHLARWMFPALRAAGGFLTITMMQLIIQA